MLRWGHGALPVVDGGARRRAGDAQGRRQGLASRPGARAGQGLHGARHRHGESRRGPRDARAAAHEREHRPGAGPRRRRGSSASSRARTCCAPSTATRYLDRGLPQARTDATRRFLESVDALLPEQVRGAIREVGALAAGARDPRVRGRRVRARHAARTSQPRRRRGGRGRRDRVRGAGGRASRRSREGAHAVRHRRARAVALACTSTSRARAPSTTRGPARCRRSSARPCGRTCCGATSRSTRWRPASTPRSSAQIADPFGGLRDLARGSHPRAALAVVRRGPDARDARRALREALRLRDGAVDGRAGATCGRDGAARRRVGRAHPCGALRDPGGGARPLPRSSAWRSSAR